MPAPIFRKAVVCYFAEIAQQSDGTYCVALTAMTVDDEEPQLLNQEIDSRRGLSLDQLLGVINNALTAN